MKHPLLRIVLLMLITCAHPWRAAAQSGENVLVVVNDASEASKRIAEYYAQKRAIPSTNVVHLKAPTADEITRPVFAGTIETPIANALASKSLQDRILYIVLTKGIPLRIIGTTGRSGTVASVDSELTLLYRRMTGAVVPIDGPVPNPYYAGTQTDVASPFSHQSQDIFLVTRLDGFTEADATGLVDRSLSAAASDAVIVLDQRGGFADNPNAWFGTTVERLGGPNPKVRVQRETTTAAAKSESPVIGYYSWGSNDSALNTRRPEITFAPGAVASMFLSFDARTTTEPPAGWKPGATPYAGSSQSLTADLIRMGVTGVAGQVAEPYLDAAIRPEILFPGYASGLNLAEAFYRAMPSLSWQTIVFGDPLCAPFRPSTLTVASLNPPIDTETELPALFSSRRLAAMDRDVPDPVRKLIARADVRGAKGDLNGAIKALEEAIVTEPRLGTSLGMLYESTGQSDKARGAYTRALEKNPNDPVALNNLAYAIAVRDHRPAEALPLAERAYRLANGSPIMADTLGWTKHLLGDDEGALPLLERAVKADPANVDMQLHVAVVYAAAGRLQDAAQALKAARDLDPAAEKREEYLAARKRIGGLSPGARP